MNVYVASSWRNYLQQGIVAALRAAGLEVYDYRAPAPGESGFRWSEIDGDWLAWTPQQVRAALAHPVAARGFQRDLDALTAADVCVLVLPCGRSAHLEAGWAKGRGKRLIVVMLEPQEPELMYRWADAICTTMNELVDALGVPR